MNLRDAVLPLDWTCYPACSWRHYPEWIARTITGVYGIREMGKDFWLYSPLTLPTGGHDSLESAKQAAQDHFNETIKAAFRPGVWG